MENTKNTKPETPELTPEYFFKLPIEKQQAILEEYLQMKNKCINSQEVKSGHSGEISKSVEYFSNAITNLSDKYIAVIEQKVKFNMRVGILGFVLVALIILSAAILTYFGKIDGSTFAFVLGLIVGYILAFIRDVIISSRL